MTTCASGDFFYGSCDETDDKAVRGSVLLRFNRTFIKYDSYDQIHCICRLIVTTAQIDLLGPTVSAIMIFQFLNSLAAIVDVTDLHRKCFVY